MKSAIKYQGLGNDFIMLDWRDQAYQEALNYLETPSWISQVQDLSHRQTGLGADGVIVILKAPTQPSIHALIYNSDGSYASFCGNGARCVADYLYKNAAFSHNFSITMGNCLVECKAEALFNEEMGITTRVSKGQYLGKINLVVAGLNFEAHQVDVGNPHLVILQTIDMDWLEQHGRDMEHYFGVNNRHNIEFIWPTDKPFHYQMLVHERGAGITKACGSGAMAATLVLEKLQYIKSFDKVTVQMLGGNAMTWLNETGEIALHAKAHPIPLAGQQLNHGNLAQHVVELAQPSEN